MDFCQSSCKGGAACVPCVRVRASLCVSGRVRVCVCARVRTRVRASVYVRACVCAGVRALRQFFSPEAWGSPPRWTAASPAWRTGGAALGVRGRLAPSRRAWPWPWPWPRGRDQASVWDSAGRGAVPPSRPAHVPRCAACCRRAGRGSHRPCAPGASAALRSCAPGQRLWRPPAPRPPCMSRGHGRLRKVRLNEAELGPAGV